MRKLRVSFFLVLFNLCFGLSAEATELSGVVKAESGKPMVGVRVLTYAPSKKREGLGITTTSQRYEVITDQNGFFRLPAHGRVLYFKRQDLRPLIKVIDLSVTRIQIMMEDGERSLWRIPVCSSLTDKSNRIGVAFKVIVPRNVFLKKATQFENGGYLYGLDLNGQTEFMVNWLESTSIEPSEEYFWASTDFSERMWVSGKTIGYETRGIKANGKRWRRVSFSGGAITYEENSKESADVFDRLIDGVCFDESDFR